MGSAELLEALRHALALLRAWPAHWLGMTLLFLLGVEALTLVPHIGFLAKVSVAGLLSAQTLVLFDRADAGHAPPLPRILEAWARPLAAQAALVGAALLPFALGLGALALFGDEGRVGFFFGELGQPDRPPPAGAALLAFKLVMHASSVALTFVAASVVMLGRRGMAAVLLALWLALRNPLALALLLGLSLGYEALAALVPLALPGPLGLLVSLALLAVVIAASLALQYTLSLRALRREAVLAGARAAVRTRHAAGAAQAAQTDPARAASSTPSREAPASDAAGADPSDQADASRPQGAADPDDGPPKRPRDGD